jgi:hypothetical protein
MHDHYQTVCFVRPSANTVVIFVRLSTNISWAWLDNAHE